MLQLCRQVQVGLDCSQRDGRLLVLSKADIGSRNTVELSTPTSTWYQNTAPTSHPNHQYPRPQLYSEENIGSFSNKIYNTNPVVNYITPPPQSSPRISVSLVPSTPGKAERKPGCSQGMRISCRNVTRTVYLEESEPQCSLSMENITVYEFLTII